MHRDVVTFRNGIDDILQVGEVEFGGDTLGVEVEGHRDQVDVSSSLSARKETSFHSISSCHETQLGRGDSSSSVVVSVKGDDDAISVFDVSTKVFDLGSERQSQHGRWKSKGLT